MGDGVCSGGRARGRGWRALLAILLITLGIGARAPTAAAATDFPRFTGAEFKAFYYASLPLPGTQRITSRPPIYGHAGADQRIQRLAEQRGYRLQVTPTVGLGSYGGVTLAADAGHAWEALLAASRRHGTPLQGNSGYRSVATQREIFRRRLGGWSTAQIASGAADNAIESVLAYHSIPGYSRHHTAKTLDLSAAGGSNGSFAGTAAYQWLSSDNYRVAKTYGFIPNYPPGAGAQGPNPEPWEFVYIGASRIRCAVEVVRLADPAAYEICGLPDAPVVGELTGDGIDDVLAYRPGARGEGYFPGRANRVQTSRAAPSVNGSYVPIAGDFRGDGVDDILWYAPGTAQDHIWAFAHGGGFVSRPTTVAGRYRAVVGDFDGNGTEDILWHGPGSAADSMWVNRADGSHASRARTVNGDYLPVAGDFNGDGIDDVLWYAPGAAQDHLWLQRADRTYSSRPVTVAGSYKPLAGDFDGDGIDDIFWYAAGSAPDHVWYHSASAGHSSRTFSANGVYTIGAGDHDGDGADDIAFLAPTGGADSVWFGRGRAFDAVSRQW